MAIAVIAVVLIAVAIAAVIFLRPKAVGQDTQAQEITDSAYGNFINIGRGRKRLAADLIYARPIKKGRESVGSGKSKTKKNVFYLTGIYIVADASVFGPAKAIVRMWADELLIYDATGESELDIKGDITVRFMYGTEDQEPDIIQIEDDGVLAQGFPFSVCVVFEDFPLKYSSDRPPNLSVEVDFENTPDVTLSSATVAPDNYTRADLPHWYFIDYSNRKIFNMVGGSSGSYAVRSEMVEYNLDTGAEVQVHDLSASPTGLGGAQFWGIDERTGNLVGGEEVGGAPYLYGHYTYDPVSKTWPMYATTSVHQEAMSDLLWQHWPVIYSQSGSIGGFLSTDHDSDETLGSPDGARNNLIDIASGSLMVRLPTPEPLAVDAHSPVPRPKWMISRFAARRNSNIAWGVWVSFDAIRPYSYKLEDGGLVTTTIYSDILVTDVRPTATTDTFSKIFGNLADTTPIIDSDGTVVYMIRIDATEEGAANGYVYFKWSPTTDGIVWVTDSLSGGPSITFASGQFRETTSINNILNGNRLVFESSSTTYPGVEWFQLDLGTGLLAPVTELSSIVYGVDVENTSQAWDDVSQCFYTINPSVAGYSFDPYSILCSVPFTDSVVSLANIIREVCTRVDLIEGTDFDVSAVTSTVWGWSIDSREKANELLADIMAPFFIQAGTQDGLIKFKDREQTSLITISAEQFIQDDNDKNILPYTITEDEESKLPSEVSVGYVDPARDYESGTSSYRRPGFPDQPILSHEKVDMGTPFALTPNEGKSIAYKWTFIPWLERDSIKGRLDWNYIEYVGNDTVSFDLGGGVIKKSRITRASIRDDFTIDFEAVFIEPGAATAAIFASSSGSFTRASALVPVPDSVQYILDINLLRDADDASQLNSVSYVASREADAPNSAWNGSITFRSYDQNDYDQIAETIESSIIGTTTSLLDTPVDPFGTEFESTLDVNIPVNGDLLSSITYQSFLSEGNPFIVLKSSGFEVGQFQNIEFLGGTSYRLSILGRGRRGTDTMVGGNAIGNVIIFPTVLTISLFDTQLTKLGRNAFFRTITSGGIFNDAGDILQPIIGNDLKPYAPVNYSVVREVGDDLTITFDRRTRVGAGFINGVYFSPLSEGSENYEVDIGATVLRTLTATTPSFTYTIGQQTTDGFTGSETQIWIEIFQLSNLVGRGYSYKLLTDIT